MQWVNLVYTVGNKGGGGGVNLYGKLKLKLTNFMCACL